MLSREVLVFGFVNLLHSWTYFVYCKSFYSSESVDLLACQLFVAESVGFLCWVSLFLLGFVYVFFVGFLMVFMWIIKRIQIRFLLVGLAWWMFGFSLIPYLEISSCVLSWLPLLLFLNLLNLIFVELIEKKLSYLCVLWCLHSWVQLITGHWSFPI